MMNGILSQNEPTVYTIGHSNRPIETFIDLLQKNEITRVLDVRTVPRSRHNPQFNQDELKQSLEAVQISYTHFPELGGLRPRMPTRLIPAGITFPFLWREYADYMQTEAFLKNIDDVISLIHTERCVLIVRRSRSVALSSFINW